MPQAIALIIALLIAGFVARSCSKHEPEAGDPGKTLTYYQTHQDQAVRDMVFCLKQDGGKVPTAKQRELGIDCINAKEVAKVALEAEKKKRIAAGTWPSASTSASTSAESAGSAAK
jgi:hypothetical protein